MSGICRYFQSGTCRAGDSCRFEHPGRNTNVFATNRFGGGAAAGGSGGSATGGAGGPAGVDLESQILTTVRQDMECVEKSGQWIFSCYSPAKDCASLPGLDDVSPEELRSEAYAAKHVQGGDQQYQTKIQNMVQDYANKRNAMKNPDNNMKKMLVKIYNKESLEAGGLFGSGSTSGTFGSTPVSSGQSQSIFGSSQANSTSAFGGQATGTLFGGASGQTASPGEGIFGGASTATGSSMFGNPSTFGGNTSSIFGGSSAAAAPTPSVFGGSATGSTATFGQAATFGQPAAPQAQQAPGSSLFGGGATSVFGQKPSISTSAFGAAPGAGTTSAFGAAPGAGTTSAFGAAPVSGTTSAFGAAPASGATSAFGAAPASGATSAFGAAPAAGATSSFGAAQPSGATSAFGAAPAAGATSVFGQPARSTSVFGVGNSSTSQPTSFFTQPPANQSSSIFAPSTTQASASIFGNSAGQSLTSQSPAQPNPGFGAAPPSTATAAFSSTPSPFGATSPFSSNPPEAGAGGAPGQSLFGQSAAPSQGMFGKPSGPNAKIKTLADEKKQMGEEMETMKDANVKAKVSLSFDLSGEDTIVESEDLRMSLDQRKIEESEDLRMSLYQRQRRVFEEVEDGDELEDGEYVDTEVSKEEDVNMIHVTVPNNQDDEASNPDLENGSKKRKAAHRRVRCQENIMSGIKKIKSNEETAEINQGDPKDAMHQTKIQRMKKKFRSTTSSSETMPMGPKVRSPRNVDPELHNF